VVPVRCCGSHIVMPLGVSDEMDLLGSLGEEHAEPAVLVSEGELEFVVLQRRLVRLGPVRCKWCKFKVEKYDGNEIAIESFLQHIICT
jgi:hypothetical protein